jgi:hydrogenase expression/formation protein HypE
MNLSCPIEHHHGDTILQAHGGGGRLMAELIQSVFAEAFVGLGLQADADSAALDIAGPVAFTTDSFVVKPIFFPGGDIGRLAVFGTVNDLAMRGATPQAISLGLILEEGLPMAKLRRIIESIATAAREADVQIVTGDTKVVERGKCDGIYINTSGIGPLNHGSDIHPRSVRPGDALILSGDLGRHATAVMASREGIAFETNIESDLCSLAAPIAAVLASDVEVHCLRDLTRGGLASAANEIANSANCSLSLNAQAIPVTDAVRGASELLGLDPLYLANEGRFLAIVAPESADSAICELRNAGCEACLIGTVNESPRGIVTLTSELGATRVLDLLRGEQLPRIC